jgi:putative ABC transport system permease protein
VRLSRLAARNLTRNRVRTALTILGGAVAVLTFVVLRTAVASWTAAADYAAKDRLVARHKITFVMLLPKKYAAEIRELPGVKAATFANFFGARDPKHDREFFFSMGAESETIFDVMDEMRVPPHQLESWKRERTGAIVGDVLAKKMGWKVGDRITLRGSLYPGDWEFRISGIYTATRKCVDRSTFVLHWSYLNEKAPRPMRDQIGWVIARAKPGAQVASICAAIDKHFDSRDPQTLTQSEREFNASFLGMMSAILRAIDVVSVAILVIMMLILGNTIAMGVHERRSEHGILRAIGFSPGHIGAMILVETALVGLAAGALGLALAYPFIDRGMGKWIEENMGAFFPFFRIETPTALLGLLLPPVLGLVAAVPAVLTAVRARVVDTLRQVA